MLVIVLAFLGVGSSKFSGSRFSGSKFVITKNLYNGSMTYQGFFDICRKEYPRSSPCTSNDLLSNGFWTTSFRWAWIFTVENNCLGYSTNSTDVNGKCINTAEFAYLTTCSCNMIQPCVCVI